MASVSIMTLPGTATVESLRDLGLSGIRVAPRDLVEGGGVSDAGIEKFRADWSPFVEGGFGLHVVTPFPGDLAATNGAATNGPATASARTWRGIGRELGESIGDLVTTWQLGNELNLWHFRRPLQRTDEIVGFVGSLGSGLRDAKPGCRLGINAFGIEDDALNLYRALYGPSAPLQLDFVGTDAYWGSWQLGGPDDWRRTIDTVSAVGGGVPVAVCEIGFPSAGGLWGDGELDTYLGRLGYRSAAEVEGDRARLLAAAPPSLADILATLPTEDWATDFEDHACHLVQKWRHLWGGQPATPDRQAAYFAAALPALLDDPRVSDVMLFIYQDLEPCWTCQQVTCPLETSWGFVDVRGRPKPVFATVQRILAERSSAAASGSSASSRSPAAARPASASG